MGDETIRDRGSYQVEYYLKNKDKLREYRRKKYESDPDYKKGILVRAKKRRVEKKIERDALRIAGLLPVRKKTELAIVYMNINNKRVRMYRFRELAKYIGKSMHTLNSWSTKGVFPKTPYTTLRGDRLYSLAMMILARIAVKSRIIISKNDGFYNSIVEGWRGIGVDI